MAVFIDLCPCLFTSKLNYAQLFKWGQVFTLACKNNIGTDTWPIIWSETNPAVSSVSLFVKNQSAKGPGKHFQILNLGCNLKASWILLKGDSRNRKKYLLHIRYHSKPSYLCLLFPKLVLPQTSFLVGTFVCRFL